MMDINFGDIFWPVLAALVASGIVFEILQVAFSFYMTKRQQKMYQEMQKKIASGEIPMPPGMSMENMLTNMEGMPMYGPGPTASGSEAPDKLPNFGQYN